MKISEIIMERLSPEQAAERMDRYLDLKRNDDPVAKFFAQYMHDSNIRTLDGVESKAKRAYERSVQHRNAHPEPHPAPTQAPRYGSNRGDDYRKDTMGRTLKHDRYYNQKPQRDPLPRAKDIKGNLKNIARGAVRGNGDDIGDALLGLSGNLAKAGWNMAKSIGKSQEEPGESDK